MQRERRSTRRTSKQLKPSCWRRGLLQSLRSHGQKELKVEFAPIDLSDTFLPQTVSVAYVDVRAFAHATEDLDKVLAAVRNVMPQELACTVVFKETALKGHHGNPITLFEARIKSRNMAQAFLEKLASEMNMIDKEQLNSEILQHLERGNLYLRLNKQSSFRGKVKLGSTDPIHVRIHFKKPRAEDVISICRQIGLLP